MLTSINLGNFKAFGEVQNMPIRPLTLIYGPNSAGKSSMFHGVAVAHEALRTGSVDVYDTEVGGSSIDLGGYSQYIFRRQIDKQFELGGEFKLSSDKGGGNLLLGPANKASFNAKFGVGQDDSSSETDLYPKVQFYEILLDENIILQIERNDNNELSVEGFYPWENFIRHRASTFGEILRLPDIEDKLVERSNEVSKDILERVKVRESDFLPIHFEQGLLDDFIGLRFRAESNNNPVEFVFEAMIRMCIRDLLTGLGRLLNDQISRFQHLGPLRTVPPRNLLLFENTKIKTKKDDLSAWYMLMQDDELRKKINDWLGVEKIQSKYELIVNQWKSITQINQEQMQIEQKSADSSAGKGQKSTVNSLSMNADNAIVNANNFRELLLKDLRTDTEVSSQDVGIGISQVIPVLVAAYGYRDRLIAIEQPESHVHPALQSELADVFINSALGDQKNTLLLETHSEHLILRVMKRIRQTTKGNLPKGLPPLTPDDVSVLYFEPKENGTRVFSVELTEQGKVSGPWPPGFFAERMEEFT